MDNNFNIDENTMNKLNDMLKNGDVSKLMANVPPDMLANFSNMMNNNSSTSNNGQTDNSQSSANSGNFDFSNIDINTIMKMKNVMEKMNNKNDPRSNLLASLKPYLRNEKKEKLDQYANLMNFAKIADILRSENNNNKES